MSKVLVDRELLERCVDRWACCAIVETPGAEQAWLELRAVVKTAQPAPAKVGGEMIKKLRKWWSGSDDGCFFHRWKYDGACRTCRDCGEVQFAEHG